MDGKTLTKIVDVLLEERGISRLELCQSIGITSAAYSAWRNGINPKPERIAQIEKFFGVNLSDYEKPETDAETAEVLQWLREDFSHRALFNSAKDLTAEQAYAAASFIEKLKAGET